MHHIQFKNISIDVIIHPHSIHVFFTEELWQEMQPYYLKSSFEIVEQLKSAFYLQNNKSIKIASSSLVAELLGHIIVFKIVSKIKLLLPRLIYNWIAKRALQIDCGEKGYDQNRWFWDLLAVVVSQKK